MNKNSLTSFKVAPETHASLTYDNVDDGTFCLSNVSDEPVLVRPWAIFEKFIPADQLALINHIPDLLTVQQLLDGTFVLRDAFDVRNLDAKWYEAFFNPNKELCSILGSLSSSAQKMLGYSEIIQRVSGLPIARLLHIQAKPLVQVEGYIGQAQEFLYRFPVDYLEHLCRTPLKFAHLLIWATGDLRLVWTVLYTLYRDTRVLIPSLLCHHPAVHYRNAPIAFETEEQQRAHFRKEGVLWKFVDEDDFLPKMTVAEINSDPTSMTKYLDKGLIFRDTCLLSGSIREGDRSLAELYSFDKTALTSIDMGGPGTGALALPGSAAYEEAVYVTLNDKHGFLVTDVVISMIKENAERLSFKEPVRHNITTPSKFGYYALLTTFLILMGSSLCSAYPVKYQGHYLTGLADYQEHFGVINPPEGPYLVCFSGMFCVRRLRVGNSTMCGDLNCSGRIWPWLCPSPDRDIPCPDENCTGCSKCHGVIQDGECRYFGIIKGQHSPRAAVKLLPTTTSNGIILGVNDAYFDGFSQYGNVTVSTTDISNETHSTSQESPSGKAGKITLLLYSISLVITLAAIVINIFRLVYSVREIHRNDKLAKGDSKDEELDEVGLIGSFEESISKSEKARKWCTVHPGASIASLTTEGVLLTLVVAGMIIVGANADYNMHTLSEEPSRIVYSDYNMPVGCSCSNPDTVESQLRCIFKCEDQAQVGDRLMKMHFDLAQTCYDKALVVLESLHERQCHYCEGGDASAWCRSLRNACNNPNCYYTDSKHQAWVAGCFKRGGSVHRLDFNYSIYPAKYCVVSQNPAPGIEGYPDTAYTYYVHSTLINQADYVRAKIQGVWQDYKSVNGALGSDRAWLVPTSDVVDGKLVPGSTAYESILRFATLNDNAEAGGKDLMVGLPEFAPVVFEQRCDVDITFSQMRCFSMDEACDGEYKKLRNVTYFKPEKTGMCGGVYVRAGEWGPAPSILRQCGNCTMSKLCIGVPSPDDQCSFHIDIHQTGNRTMNATDGLAWVEVEQSLMGVLYMVAGIALIVIVAVIIVALVRKISHRNYVPVSN